MRDDEQTNKRTNTEDRATQPMEAGGWVSQKEKRAIKEEEKTIGTLRHIETKDKKKKELKKKKKRQKEKRAKKEEEETIGTLRHIEAKDKKKKELKRKKKKELKIKRKKSSKKKKKELTQSFSLISSSFISFWPWPPNCLFLSYEFDKTN